MGTYSAPGPIKKDIKHIVINKTDKHPCPHGAYILVGKTNNNQVLVYVKWMVCYKMAREKRLSKKGDKTLGESGLKF